MRPQPNLFRPQSGAEGARANAGARGPVIRGRRAAARRPTDLLCALAPGARVDVVAVPNALRTQVSGLSDTEAPTATLLGRGISFSPCVPPTANHWWSPQTVARPTPTLSSCPSWAAW